MRTVLLLASFAALACLWALTANAVLGPHPLPARIPTHFDLAGHPNGWGEPRMLWLFPFVGTIIFSLMSLVARFPRSFNYPMRVTAETRPRMEAITLTMIAWLRLELLCLFLWIQFAIIRSARDGQNALSPAFVPLVLVAVFGTIAWHFVALLRVKRGSSS